MDFNVIRKFNKYSLKLKEGDPSKRHIYEQKVRHYAKQLQKGGFVMSGEFEQLQSGGALPSGMDRTSINAPTTNLAGGNIDSIEAMTLGDSPDSAN